MDLSELNACIEVQHIKLELIHRRSQHMRHFVDQYYCYRNGYINTRGRADWEGMLWIGHVSREASALRERGSVVKEHVVPLRVIVEKLKQLEIQDSRIDDAIRAVLDRYVHFATISKSEDERLRNLQLGSKMPDGFTESGHEYHEDLFSRYKAANIELSHHAVSCRPVEKP